MELIRRPGNRRVVAPPGTTVGERHGEALVTPCERSSRARQRTGELLGAIRKLDTATDERTKRRLLDSIEGLYNDFGSGMPAGLFTKCWLGEPYPDRIFTFSGDTVQHFKHSEPVSPEFAMTRPLVRSDAYAFIEVYNDGAVILTRPDGNPATWERRRTISTSIGLTPLSRQTNEVGREVIDNLGSQIDDVQANLGTVHNDLQLTRSELANFREEPQQFVEGATRVATVQQSQVKIVDLKVQLDREFGYYSVVCRTSIGLPQGFDVGNISNAVATNIVEKPMIQTPRYWLAPVLAAPTA